MIGSEDGCDDGLICCATENEPPLDGATNECVLPESGKDVEVNINTQCLLSSCDCEVDVSTLEEEEAEDGELTDEEIELFFNGLTEETPEQCEPFECSCDE